MSDYNKIPAVLLVNKSTGAPVGFVGNDGNEYPSIFGAVYGANSLSIGTGGALGGTFGGTINTSATSASSTLTIGSGAGIGATVTDSSGTPGNVTINQMAGKAAFAAAASSVVVTNSKVTAASVVVCQMEGADTTLTSVLRVVPAAGSFTVTGNAAATAATKFSFLVIG